VLKQLTVTAISKENIIFISNFNIHYNRILFDEMSKKISNNWNYLSTLVELTPDITYNFKISFSINSFKDYFIKYNTTKKLFDFEFSFTNYETLDYLNSAFINLMSFQ
jgi:hypothetical protein